MSNKLINFFQDSLENDGFITLDQIRKIVLETSSYFDSIENLLQYGDSGDREGALASVLEIKEFLDTKVNEMPSDMHSLSAEDQEMVAEMVNGLQLGKNRSLKINKLKPIKLR